MQDFLERLLRTVLSSPAGLQEFVRVNEALSIQTYSNRYHLQEHYLSRWRNVLMHAVVQLIIQCIILYQPSVYLRIKTALIIIFEWVHYEA